MSKLPRRSVLFSAALAPIAVPTAQYARADESLSVGLMTSVKDFGALGDGKTNDTNAIERAFDAAGSNGTIFFPPGNYIYTGQGIEFNPNFDVRVIGASNNSAKINLGEASYFIDHGTSLRSLMLRDLTFTGGKGAFRHTFRGANVQQKFLVHNCRFKDYAECAIATDSSDMPYWIIRDCMFDSANTTDTVGVALGGLTDQCIIDACSFIRNRVHVKARGGGNNLHVTRCDFLQFSQVNSSGPRVSVWVVPASSWTNSGQGLTITGCKFGNENLRLGDCRILYADEGSGATNGTRLPNLEAESSAYVSGHNITQNLFAGQGEGSHSIIYSTTPYVRDTQLHHNGISGGPPSYAIEFKNPSNTPNTLTDTNLIGPFTGALSSQYPPFAASNANGVGYWVDPQAENQTASSVRNWLSGSSASFRKILYTEIGDFDVVSAETSATTDAYGGADAILVNFPDSRSAISTNLTIGGALTVGMPLWVEFDVSGSGDENNLKSFFAEVRDDAGRIHWRRCISVPSNDKGWIGFSFCFTPRTEGIAPRARINFTAVDSSAAAITFKLGRLRIYHANERQLGGIRPTVGAAAKDLRDGIELVNEIRSGLIRLGLVSETTASIVPAEPSPPDVPLHSNSAGAVGRIAWDSKYLYICTATDTWRRVALGDGSW